MQHNHLSTNRKSHVPPFSTPPTYKTAIPAPGTAGAWTRGPRRGSTGLSAGSALTTPPGRLTEPGADLPGSGRPLGFRIALAPGSPVPFASRSDAKFKGWADNRPGMGVKSSSSPESSSQLGTCSSWSHGCAVRFLAPTRRQFRSQIRYQQQQQHNRHTSPPTIHTQKGSLNFSGSLVRVTVSVADFVSVTVTVREDVRLTVGVWEGLTDGRVTLTEFVDEGDAVRSVTVVVVVSVTVRVSEGSVSVLVSVAVRSLSRTSGDDVGDIWDCALHPHMAMQRGTTNTLHHPGIPPHLPREWWEGGRGQ
eukprot:Hpha_TRINITY_DN23367_c0_g1::TRINITY_DN23367_c0_g1_i1::g.97000::m.97000